MYLYKNTLDDNELNRKEIQMIENRVIDKTIPNPMYYQIKMILFDEIQKGNYLPGSSIPTELELMNIFGVSRITVQRAVNDLVKEGVLYREKSKGTFVSKPRFEWEMENKTPSFSRQIIASGRKPSIKVLRKEITAIPTEIMNAEFSFKSDKVITLYRIRYADDDPIVYQHTYIDMEKGGYVFDIDFEKEKLLQALEKHPQSRIVRICRTAEATLADSEDSKYLNVDKGSAILKITQYSLNKNDELVECTISRYKSSEGKMHIEFYI